MYVCIDHYHHSFELKWMAQMEQRSSGGGVDEADAPLGIDSIQL